LTVTPDFKPGDPEPENAGYLDWHAWADVQHKAGIKPKISQAIKDFPEGAPPIAQVLEV
jgi:hypothetical protein